MTGQETKPGAVTSPGPAPSALKLPKELKGDGLLVAWSLEGENKPQPIGFHYGDPGQSPATGYLDPVLFTGEGHLMTIAPTGAGKGTGCIIPALLLHEGSAIVVDPKGENYAVTARRRRDMGQKVILIDPMAVTGDQPDTLNPFDAVDPEKLTDVDETAALIDALWPSEVSSRDQFWRSRANQFLLAAALHLLHDHPEERRSFAEVRLLVDRAIQNPPIVLEEMRTSRHPEVRQIAAMLSLPAEETLAGILSFAQEAVSFFRGPLVQDATSSSSFDLAALTRDQPLTIYLVLPPHMMESHGRLLRIWISVLMTAISRRRGKPKKSTLFILDEAAQLGTLPQLRQAITLLRGYGMQTWSFWQDVSQLQLLYPEDWQTMVNNCSVVMTFGAKNFNAARSMSDLSGFFDPYQALALDFDEMLLSNQGDDTVVAQRPNYLTDPVFAGLWDANPLHQDLRSVTPPSRHPKRMYIRPRTETIKKLISKDENLLDDLLAKWREDVLKGSQEKGSRK